MSNSVPDMGDSSEGLHGGGDRGQGGDLGADLLESKLGIEVIPCRCGDDPSAHR